MGYPPQGQQQMGYGQPSGQYGQPTGYLPSQQFPGQPMHQQHTGQYPPHAQQPPSSSMPQQQPPQQTPAPAPAAPDPFSSMGGTAWGSVGGKPPPQSIPSYGDSTEAPAVDNNPF